MVPQSGGNTRFAERGQAERPHPNPLPQRGEGTAICRKGWDSFPNGSNSLFLPLDGGGLGWADENLGGISSYLCCALGESELTLAKQGGA